MEFVLTLAEGLARVKEQPSPEHLRMLASAFLIPLEYETLNRILCPQCSGHTWETSVRESLAKRVELEWPYHSPGGDRHHSQCKRCGQQIVVTFWFAT